ncbi:cat eye syndrome chromosome region, candidate 2 [Globomyces sp. JEL0801]|nr:cat eye syndrome chromosome region, candidate 2 [Globomyces sp. JEL0801]
MENQNKTEGSLVIDPKSKDVLLAKIRSLWQFAAVCQFFQLFQEAFTNQEFDTEDLEEIIIQDSDDNWLIELQLKMLRMATKNRFIMSDCWLMYLEREIQKRLDDSEIPFFTYSPATSKYSQLEVSDRVFILHFVCEIQLEKPESFKFNADFTELEARGWRVEPIGSDSKGNIYWLFDDSRLCMESPGKSITESIFERSKTKWTLVCKTRDDWLSFPERFQDSKNQMDKNLYKYLSNDLLPVVLADIEHAETKRVERKRWLEEQKKIEEQQMLEELQRIADEEAEAARKLEMKPVTRQTRAGSRNPKRPPPTAEEAKQERLEERERRRLQRGIKYEVPLFEDVKKDEDDQFDGGDYEVPKKKVKRKKPPPKKKVTKRKKYDSDEDSEDENDYMSDSDGVESFVNSPSPPPDLDEWLFSCICGVKGVNLDAKHIDGPDVVVDVDAWNKRDFTCDSCLGNAVKPKLPAANGELTEKSEIVCDAVLSDTVTQENMVKDEIVDDNPATVVLNGSDIKSLPKSVEMLISTQEQNGNNPIHIETDIKLTDAKILNKALSPKLISPHRNDNVHSN